MSSEYGYAEQVAPQDGSQINTSSVLQKPAMVDFSSRFSNPNIAAVHMQYAPKLLTALDQTHATDEMKQSFMVRLSEKQLFLHLQEV